MGRGAKTVGDNSKTDSAAGGSPLVEWFFRPAMLVRMSLVAGTCALWPYAAQKLPALGARPEYRMSFSQIQISPQPESPVPGQLVEQVAALTEVPRELSILDDDLNSKVADAFQRHPWIARVIRVRKSFPAAISVELEYRTPVALIEVQNGRLPIDINGVILPSADFSANDSNRYPLIRNPDSKPNGRAGEIWNDPAILAAARLASLLGEKWKPLKVEAISVPRTTDSSIDSNDIPLELIGRGGSRIVWGRAPGNDHPGELESSQKIRRLEKYLTDFGDYGQPNGPYEIDIRHWQEISRRPLAGDQAQAKPVKNARPDPKTRQDQHVPKPQEAKFQRPERRR